MDSSYDIHVFTTEIRNLNKFKRSNIHCFKRSYVEEIISKIKTKFFGKYQNLSFRQINSFSALIDENKIELIHAHFGYGALQIYPIAKKKHIPLLVHFHGVDASLMLKKKNYVEQLREMMKYAKAIAVSKHIAANLIDAGIPEDRIEVQYLGIPIELFKYVKRTSPSKLIKTHRNLQFIQVSNFVEKKGHIYSILAFQKLLNICPGAHLNLIGEGPLLHSCKKVVHKNGLSNKIKFLGVKNSEEVAEIMKKSDIFLHHSITSKKGDQEGLPTVLMEAMSTGMIIISTFHSGIPELVKNGFNGFLVREKDIEGYFFAMKEVLQLGDDRINQNARKTVVSSFRLDKNTEYLKKKYSDTITKKQF